MSKYNPKYAKEYRRRNKEKITDYQRGYLKDYKEKNPEKVKKWAVEWEIKNREYRTLKQKARYYRNKKATPLILKSFNPHCFKKLPPGEYTIQDLQLFSKQGSLILIEKIVFKHGGTVSEYLDTAGNLKLLYKWPGY